MVANRFAGDAKRIIDVVRIGVGLTRRTEEAAELAVGVTDVGRVEVPVDVVIGHAPVQAPPDGVGKAPERGHVGGRKERKPVLETEPFAGLDLVGQLVEFEVV